MNSKNRFILINLLAFEFILLNLVLFAYLGVALPKFSFGDSNFLFNMVMITIIYNFSWLFIILYVRNNEFYFNPEHGNVKSIITSVFFFVGFVISLVILFKMTYFNRSTYIIPIFLFSYLNLVSFKY